MPRIYHEYPETLAGQYLGMFDDDTDFNKHLIQMVITGNVPPGFSLRIYDMEWEGNHSSCKYAMAFPDGSNIESFIYLDVTTMAERKPQ